jgi:hypothetical protein
MSVATSNSRLELPTNLPTRTRRENAQIDAKSLTSKAIDLSVDKPQENLVIISPELRELSEKASVESDQITSGFNEVTEVLAVMHEHAEALSAAMNSKFEKLKAHSVLVRDKFNNFWADYYQKFVNTEPVAPVRLNEEQVSWITKELSKQGTRINASTEEHFVYFEDQIYTFKPDGSAYVQDQGVPTSEEDRLSGVRRLQQLLSDIEENKQGKSIDYWREVETSSTANIDEHMERAEHLAEVIDARRKDLTSSQTRLGETVNITA